MQADSTASVEAPMTDSSWRWVGVVLAPFVLTIAVVTLLYGTVGLTPVPRAPTAVYAAANVLAVASLWRWLSPSDRFRVFRYGVPGREEFGAAVAVAVVNVFAFDPLATAVANFLGAGGSSAGSFESTVGAVVFAVGAVVVVPVAEEVLFRGFALTVLRERRGVVAAVVGSTVLFAVVHVFSGGVTGVVSAVLAGLAYAGMRVRYDNLAGVGVAHALNNAYWVAVMLGAIPNLVPG